MKILDVKGLKCPMPLIETKKALKSLAEGELLKIVIDNDTSVKNVEHYLTDNGMKAEIKKNNGIYELITGKQGADLENTQPELYCTPANPALPSYVVLFAKDRLGEGSDELGNALVGAMLNSIKNLELRPQKMIFMNSGINLVTTGSLVLPMLKNLEEQGVEMITCGTCLDYFGKMEDLQVGRVSNMHEIMENLLSVSKIINI
jgi:selenium metabolism protein YedF